MYIEYTFMDDILYVRYDPDETFKQCSISEVRQYINSLESELARLREERRWIPIDDEPAPEDPDNYGALVYNGKCYLVRKPPEVE